MLTGYCYRIISVHENILLREECRVCGVML